MSRATIAAALLSLVPPALVAGCADTARNIYFDEVVEDLPYAPTGDPGRLQAAGVHLRDLASEAAVSTALTLTDCMRLALVNYEYLLARGENILQADTLKAEAITALLPRAGLDFHHTRNSNSVSFGDDPTGRPFLKRDFTENSVFVTQPLFVPTVLPNYWAASATRRIEAMQLDDLRDEVLFQVSAAFYDVLGFERDIRALRSTLEQVEEQLRVLNVRLAVGEAQRQEVLLAEARRAEVEVQLVQAELDRETARARLSRLTGVRVPLTLVDTLSAEPPRGDVATLVARAHATRPDLAAARASVELAEANRNAVIAEYLPTITLDFTYFTHAVSGFNQFLDWTLTANMRWTAIEGGARAVRLARARSIERERRLLVEALAEDIRLEVIEAALAYAALERAQRALTARRVAAVGAQELAALQFAAGEATNLDVLVAVAERQAAELNEIRGQYALKLAALRIWLVTGQITRSAAARGVLPDGRR